MLRAAHSCCHADQFCGSAAVCRLLCCCHGLSVPMRAHGSKGCPAAARHSQKALNGALSVPCSHICSSVDSCSQSGDAACISGLSRPQACQMLMSGQSSGRSAVICHKSGRSICQRYSPAYSWLRRSAYCCAVSGGSSVQAAFKSSICTLFMPICCTTGLAYALHSSNARRSHRKCWYSCAVVRSCAWKRAKRRSWFSAGVSSGGSGISSPAIRAGMMRVNMAAGQKRGYCSAFLGDA